MPSYEEYCALSAEIREADENLEEFVQFQPHSMFEDILSDAANQMSAKLNGMQEKASAMLEELAEGLPY